MGEYFGEGFQIGRQQAIAEWRTRKEQQQTDELCASLGEVRATCGWCGNRFFYKKTKGRQRKWCSPRCCYRAAYYRNWEEHAMAAKERMRETRAEGELLERDHGKLFATQLSRWRLCYLHVPNEGQRSVMEASALIEEGMRPGACDYLVFTVPAGAKFKGVGLELKRPGWVPKNAKDKKRFAAQVQFLKELADNGWATKICYGWQAAVAWMEMLGYR